ncbi:MAG: Crp/Fnr family transcriptional regulator [Erysipelotrichaceae bacterium]|nr:Crp/Fnr family transcriptional regulator [Erysipelotrichaceae bacterium]
MTGNKHTAQITDLLQTVFDKAVSLNTLMKIQELSTIQSFQKGEIILYEGDRATAIFLILRGIVRGYYIDEQGNDITKCFSCEKEFFATEGFRTGGESTFTIECIRDCVCLKLSYSIIRELIQEDAAFSQQVGLLFEREVGRLEARQKLFSLYDATDRYRFFCREYPALIKRVPLKHIASFLGVRPSTLSRLRKKEIVS